MLACSTIVNLNNVNVYLNSEFYPYDDLNLDSGKKKYAVLFDVYAHFHKVYYGIIMELLLRNAAQRAFV